MKRYFWLSCFLSTSLLAQQPTNNPAPAAAEAAATPAPTNATPSATAGTNAPNGKTDTKKKKKSAKPQAAKKKNPAAELKSVPLIAGPAIVIASNVNVRGQAGLKGEVITRLMKEQPVIVIEEITLKKSGPDEPSAWAKILLPTNTHVWVNGTFLDTNKAVRPKKLNVRGGPGENYSVVGTLKQGEAVKDLASKGDWLQIEAPADAFGYVAAQYLKQETAPAVAAVTTPEPAPTPAPVTEPTPVATSVTETPTPTPAPAPAPTPEPTATNPAPSTVSAPAPATEEPPPPRIVQREGLVRGTVSIQAPTSFELISPDNHRAINYLYTTSRDLDLRRYKGLRVIVTGEESLDERWRNTPVITIQRIQPIADE